MYQYTAFSGMPLQNLELNDCTSGLFFFRGPANTQTIRHLEIRSVTPSRVNDA